MINLNDTVQTALVKLSQGNPGALTVCCEILKADSVMGFMDLLHMDDMGMRGPAIWIGYKDFAGENLQKFISAVRSRSKEMVEVIRKEGYGVSTGGGAR